MNLVSKLSILINVTLLSCAFAPPSKTYKVQLWQADPIQRVIRAKLPNGNIVEIDTGDLQFGDKICLTPEDYLKEITYQKLLISKCSKWRK